MEDNDNLILPLGILSSLLIGKEFGMRGKIYAKFFRVQYAFAITCSSVALSLCATAGNAASGDILYQNCTSGTTCSGAASKNGWNRTVQTTGCQSGSCLKLVGTANNGKYGSGNTSITASGISGKKEITVTYWIKFNKSSRSIKSGNIKAFRPLTGSSYYFANMGPHFGWDYYGSVNSGPMTVTDKVTSVKTNTGYSKSLGGYNYNNPDGRFDLKFTAGGHSGFGAYWTKVRHWMKLPTTLGGSNGESKIWINEQLIATFTNQKASKNAQTTFGGFTFYPSSEAGEPFEHWMDEMIVYDGYVPPGGTTNPAPASPPPPQGLNISAVN
jgi:hypothetical protein